jgi:hypothetical protein
VDVGDIVEDSIELVGGPLLETPDADGWL